MIKLKDLLLEQTGPLRADHDGVYDYQVQNGTWHTKKKTGTKWFSLAKFPDAQNKLNKAYPEDLGTKVSKSDKSTTKTKEPSKKYISPFKTTTGERDFQDWVNNKAGKDITGGYGWGRLSQAA